MRFYSFNIKLERVKFTLPKLTLLCWVYQFMTFICLLLLVTWWSCGHAAAPWPQVLRMWRRMTEVLSWVETVEVVQSCDVMPTLHTPQPVSVSSNLPPEQQLLSHFILNIEQKHIMCCVVCWFNLVLLCVGLRMRCDAPFLTLKMIRGWHFKKARITLFE